MTAAASSLDLEGLLVTARVDGANMVVELNGTADQFTSDRLTEFLDTIHADAVRDAVDTVVLDMRRLEFMNSSSFKSLVTWVTNIQDLEPEKRYRIRVQSNASIPWQKRSLKSLTYFAVDLVTVEYPPSS